MSSSAGNNRGGNQLLRWTTVETVCIFRHQKKERVRMKLNIKHMLKGRDFVNNKLAETPRFHDRIGVFRRKMGYDNEKVSGVCIGY